MKTFRLIGMAIMAILISVNFTACSNEDSVSETPKDCIVSLSFKGDIINTVESPLTRAESNDLYYITVSLGKEDGYASYAHGLFDDVSAMKIKLTSKQKYIFGARIVKNGKEKIHHINQTYSAPFNCDLNNEFIYEKNSRFDDSIFTLSDGENYRIPNIDFYVSPNGTEYTAVENGNVSIYMARFSFGAKFIADNLTEGSLKITLFNDSLHSELYKSPTISIDYPNTTVEDIFHLNPDILTNGVSEFRAEHKVSLVWVKGDGTETELGTPVITFWMNKLTTITVRVDKSTENGISFGYYESEEMGDGGSYIVDGNDVSTTEE